MKDLAKICRGCGSICVSGSLSDESESEMEEREVRLFVSSTFRDMYFDREVLVKQVFPEISRFCHQRGVEFTGIDLRTGVTAEQSRDGMTLNLCLQEIDRCRPYFIGLLGERYGWSQADNLSEGDSLLTKTFEATLIQHPEYDWISQLRDRSVTEIEIRHAVLNNASLAKRAIFFFRKSNYHVELLNEGLITSEESCFYLSESEQAKLRLDRLKEEILSIDVPVIHYDHHQNLRDLVIRFLKTNIAEDYPEVKEVDPLRADEREHNSFADSRCRVYIGREIYYQSLSSYVFEFPIENPHDVFYICGDSGSGKSSLLANWATLVRNSSQHLPQIKYLHMHFIGSSPNSADAVHMIHRLMTELNVRVLQGSPLDLPADWQGSVLRLPEILDLVSSKMVEINDFLIRNQQAPQLVVIIIDAVNQLSDTSGAFSETKDRTLKWIPRTLPPYVRLIVSSIDSPPTYASTRPGLPQLVQITSKYILNEDEFLISPTNILQVTPLDPEGVKSIAVEYMKGYGKTLAGEQLRMIMACEQTKNPLFLRSVLEEVRVWGKYELLNEQISHYLTKETIGDLFDAILSRIENDFNTPSHPTLVKDAVALLWCSRYGLSESEWMTALRIPRSIFSCLFLSLQQNLINRSGFYSLFHDSLRQTVAEKYLPCLERKAVHLKLAKYFCQVLLPTREEGCESQDVWNENYHLNRRRALDEILWQLQCSCSLTGLSNLLTIPTVAMFLNDGSNRIDLFRMWRVCGNGSYSLAAERYLNECRSLFSLETPNSIEFCISDSGDFELDFLIPVISLERKSTQALTLTSKLELARNISTFLIRAAQYKAASEILQLAKGFAEELGDEESCISILAEQGRIYLSLCQYQQGIDLCQSLVYGHKELQDPTIEDKRKKPKQSHAYLDVEYTLALLFSANGLYGNAEPLFQKVLTQKIALHGENNVLVADVMNDLAKHYFTQRKYAQSVELLERVLAVRRSITGEKSLGFISTLRDIGMLCHDLAEYEKAERYFSNALSSSESVYGFSHPAVADILNEYAFAKYMHRRNNPEMYEEVSKLYERALLIRIETYGENHKDVANTLNHLANLYRAKFEGDQRNPFTSEASRGPFEQEQFGESTLNFHEGSYEEAAKEHEAILLLRQDIYGPDNIQTATSYKNCGLAYAGLGNYEKALMYHHRSLGIREEGFGKFHPKTAESLACLGDLYIAWNKPDMAIPFYTEAMNIWNLSSGENNSSSLRALDLIEKILSGQQITTKLAEFF